MVSKPAQKILFFYCYECRDYELKTSPHYRNQKRRFARRREKERLVREKEDPNGSSS